MRLWPTGAAALLLAGTLAPSAHAQVVTASGSAAASVVRPLSAMAEADLSFGAISLGTGQAAGGNVVVAPQGGAATYGGSVRQICGGNSACQPHPARFAVSGEADRAYRVTLPTTVVAIGTRSGAGLAVADLALLSRNSAGASGGLLDASGSDSFTVGGTLQVLPGTQADTYRAEFAVTVAYD